MRILDRYILKSVANLFFGCLFVFFSLYIIIDVFANLDEILKHKATLEVILQYYSAFLPIIFVQVTPVALLLATLYTFGKLNRNNEIIAMRASGLSIYQIAKNVIIFGAIISLTVFWVNDKFVPHASLLTERIKKQMETGMKKPYEKEIIENLCMYGLKNRLFFVNRFNTATSTMEGIIILEHDDKQNLTKKIVANKGIYKDGYWKFYQNITYYFDEESQMKQEPQYQEEEIMTIPETPAEFLTQRQRPDFMSIKDLDSYIWRLSKSGATTVIRNLKVDIYQRFTSPFTNIIIILLGIPFSLRMRKRATGMSSVGVSVMLGFLYYVLNAVCIALGKTGILSPFLSASLSHIAAFLVAVTLINKLP